jgi:hypothetical protein
MRIGLNPTNIDAANRLEIEYMPAPTNFNTANGHPAIPLAPLPTGYSGLRLTDLHSNSKPEANPNGIALSVNGSGDVILVPEVDNSNNGTSISTVTPGTVVLGENVNQLNNPGKLINSREIPLNTFDLICTQTTPDNFASGKVGFGIAPGNIGVNALRPSNTTMQVNGSISLFDGTGNTSLFFGENTIPSGPNNFGQWGIHYDDAAGNSGLNFWKPFGGNNFGNRFLFLGDNGNVGVGSTQSILPVNTLEIYSGVAPTTLNPISSLVPTRSGLRFSNLNNTMAPDAAVNPSGKVLSVNSTGDVILVPSVTGGGLIGYCPNVPALTGSAGMNLNGNTFYFEGQGAANTNDVGIGILCGTLLTAKLDVSNFSEPIGIQGSSNQISSNTLTGIQGLCTGSTSRNKGVWGSSSGSATFNEGVEGNALGAISVSLITNIGGSFTAIAPAGNTNNN